MTLAERKTLDIFLYLKVPIDLQVIIGPYIVDFIGRDRNFILELDGGIHDQKLDYDDRRTAFLDRMGFNIERLDNKNVDEKHILSILGRAEYVGEEHMQHIINSTNRKYGPKVIGPLPLLDI